MKPASPDSIFRRIVAALCMVLLVASCGGGSDRDRPASAQASDPEAAEVARQLSAGDAQAADAVVAAQAATQATDSEAAQGLFGFGRRIRQVVVFGDSLSDVGTYRVGDIAAVGGGKFTTNPGWVWSEVIGILFGARVTPFRQGFGGVSQVVGGTGFAMGGSRVSQQPGIGCVPDAATGACTQALTIPVTQQITDYLGANGDRFNPHQMVFVFAGANDVFFQLDVFAARVNTGMPVLQAQGLALEAMGQAALELADEVRRIRDHGPARIAVLTVPDIANSIFGRAPEQAAIKPLIAAMVQTFNGTLVAALARTPAKIIDTYAQSQDVMANPGKYGVSELNVPACDAGRIAAITLGRELNGSSLFCSPLTLVQQFAPFTFLFADSVHPTTIGHLNIARFVLTEMWKQGLF